MVLFMRNADDCRELKRLAAVKKSRPHVTAALGEEMIAFFRQSVQKRQTKLAIIAKYWEVLVPEFINDHCAWKV